MLTDMEFYIDYHFVIWKVLCFWRALSEMVNVVLSQLEWLSSTQIWYCDVFRLCSMLSMWLSVIFFRALYIDWTESARWHNLVYINLKGLWSNRYFRLWSVITISFCLKTCRNEISLLREGWLFDSYLLWARKKLFHLS